MKKIQKIKEYLKSINMPILSTSESQYSYQIEVERLHGNHLMEMLKICDLSIFPTANRSIEIWTDKD